MRTRRRKSENQTLFRKMRRTILLFTFVPIGILLLIGMPLLYRQQSQKMRNEVKAEMEDQLDRMNNSMNMIELLARSVSTDSHLALEINKAIIQDSMSDYEKFVFSSQTLSTMKVVMSVKQIKAARIFVDFPGIREYTPYLYQMDRAHESGWFEYRDSISVSGEWYLDVTDQKREVTYSGYYQGDDMAAFVIPGKINSTTASIFEIVLPMQELVPELYTDWKERDFLIVDRQGKVHGANPEMPFGAVKADRWEELLGEDIFQNWGGGIGLYRIWQDFHPIEVAVAQRGGIFLIYTVSLGRPLLLLLGEMGGIVLVGLLLSCLILYAVNKIVKRLLADLDSFTECVREVGQGNLEVEIPRLSQIEVKEVALEYKRMLENLKMLTEQAIHSEILIRDAQLKALEKQINAHFLYNVLDSIKMMAEIKGIYEVSDALLALGRMFRYSLAIDRHEVTLREEIAYLENYLKLSNIRYDYTIYLCENIEEPIYELKVPKMCLQPIVENAVAYGLDELAEDTTIYLKAYEQGEIALIELTDMGKGMSEEVLEKVREQIYSQEAFDRHRHGIGLRNVHERIQLMYGDTCGVWVYSKKSCYTKVVLTIRTTQKSETGSIQEGKNAENSDCGR